MGKFLNGWKSDTQARPSQNVGVRLWPLENVLVSTSLRRMLFELEQPEKEEIKNVLRDFFLFESSWKRDENSRLVSIRNYRTKICRPPCSLKKCLEELGVPILDTGTGLPRHITTAARTTQNEGDFRGISGSV